MHERQNCEEDGGANRGALNLLNLERRQVFGKDVLNAEKKLMKTILNVLAIGLVALGFASCAQPEQHALTAKAAPAGSRFDGIGSVALYAGQPCTSQIMFELNALNSPLPVLLAARVREEKTLTSAAKRNSRVHVSGTWARGRKKGCSYVNVAKAETSKSFW